jgi:hypothetical protein
LYTEKVICQKLLQNSSIEEEENSYFAPFFAYNFLVRKFFGFFSTVLKSAQNSELFDTKFEIF